MNTVHRTGYTIPNDTNGNVSQTDVDFFEDTSAARDGSEVTAQNFRLSSAVLENVYNIAASDSPVAVAGEENEQRGNGKIALAMAELVNHTDTSGNPDNFDSAYKSIVTGIGIEMNTYPFRPKRRRSCRRILTSKENPSAEFRWMRR